MKRTLAGVGLLAVAGIGSVAMAPSGGAAESEPTYVELEATWSPNPAAPGETVTLTPNTPCPLDVDPDNGNTSDPGVVIVYTDEDGEEIPMNEDGSWSFETVAPDAPGEYTLDVECRNGTWQEEMNWCGIEDEEDFQSKEATPFELASYSKPVAPTWNWFDCEFEYYSATLTVESDDEEETPPTTEVDTPVPPPAVPVPDEPDFAG